MTRRESESLESSTVTSEDHVHPNLLYYLTEAQEWTIDQPESTVRSPNLPIQPTTSVTWVSLLAQWFRLTSLHENPVCILRSVRTQQFAWHIALSPNGSHLVIAKDYTVELRSNTNSSLTASSASLSSLATGSSQDPMLFDTVLMQLKLETHEPCPQWRLIVWLSSGTHFGVGSSTGSISVFDTRGAQVATLLPPEQEQGIVSSQPLAGFFLDVNTVSGSSGIMILAFHVTGLIRIAVTDSQNSSSCQILHQFNLSERLCSPILSVDYSPQSGMLAMGTLIPQNTTQRPFSSAFQSGLLFWRRIDESPFLKPGFSTEDDLHIVSQCSYWKQRFNKWGRRAGVVTEGITKLRISSDSTRLVVLQSTGEISVWTFPSGQLLWSKPLIEQPYSDSYNPLLIERRFSGVAPRVIPINISNSKIPSAFPINVEWWGVNDLVVIRQNGSLSILKADDAVSQTGDSPEWFEPFSQVSSAQCTSTDAFLVLECESRRKRKRADDDSEHERVSAFSEDEDDDFDDDCLDNKSLLASLSWRVWMARTGRYVRRIFAIDQDEPLRKRLRLAELHYRLVCFKSTTPEELFQRKIVDEEYGEALRLALKYNLDTDVVYQKQWHKSRMTRSAIEDFLTRITKRNWILHECLERIPEDLDSLRSLLEFGLQATDVDALLAAGLGDTGHPIITTSNQWIDDVGKHAAGTNLNPDDERALMDQCEVEYRCNVLDKINGKKLTLMQIEILRIRYRLLAIIDRLDTYEQILGGSHCAPQRFKADNFVKFRDISLVEAAINYARAGQYDALSIMFERYATHLNRHRLAILWNISETEDPITYSFLLPELGKRLEDEEVIGLQQYNDREPDWCEIEPVSLWYNSPEPEDEAVNQLYQEEPQCLQFCIDNLSRENLANWFELRARDIDAHSKQTSNALSLIRLGIERGIEGLQTLYHDLLQLDMLIYDCRVKIPVSLEDYGKMSDIEKVELMMSETNEDMFIKHFCKWLLPFLKSVDKETKGRGEKLLRSYLLSISQGNLTYFHEILKNRSTNNITDVWIKDPVFMAQLTVDILNDCELTEQHKTAESILRLVPRYVKTDPPSHGVKIEADVAFLNKCLGALLTLERYGVQRSFKFIRKNRDNPESVNRLMMEVIHKELKRTPQLNKEKIGTMLNDLHATVSEVLTSIHPKMLYKIAVEAILLSSEESKIHVARDFMDLDGKVKPLTSNKTSSITNIDSLLSFNESVECVVSAAREYFNSAVNSHDVAISLAMHCLGLVHGPSDMIRDELRLISGLKFLESAGVSILPVELRNNRSRADLLESALKTKKDLYKDFDKVLEAGISLKIGRPGLGDDDVCKGEALRLIAKCALHVGDIKTALTAGRSIVKRNYGRGWEECIAICRHEACPRDKEDRCLMANFSVAHCDGNELRNVLKLCSKVEAEYLKIKHFSSSSSSHKDTEASLLLKQGKMAIQKVVETSKKIRDVSGFTVNNQKGDCQKSSNDSVRLQYNECFFYSDHDLAGDITNYLSDTINFNETQMLYRIYQLDSDVNELDESIFVKLFSESIEKDSLLALAYSVHIKKLEDVKFILSKLPPSTFNHHFALIVICLRILHLSGKTVGVDKLNLCIPNHEIVQEAENVVGYLDSEEGVALINYRNMYDDFIQAKRLIEISSSVDLTRFTSDSAYKEETILGLCMTEDDDQYSFAMSLARRYAVDKWEAAMTFLEYLLCDSELIVTDIDAKLKRNGVINLVRSDKELERFEARMQTLYDSLDGRNFNKLIYFFTCLEDTGVKISGLEFSSHLSALKKLKSAAPNLNYKQLVALPSSNNKDNWDKMDSIVLPHLNSNNVHVFAKLANCFHLTSSCVYSAWARQVFWDGTNASSDKPPPVTAQDWIQRYQTCAEYLSRLAAPDFVKFLEGCVFGPGASRVTSEGRLEILRRGLKFCHQQQSGSANSGAGGKKQRAATPDSKEEQNAAWKTAQIRIKELSDHLQFVLTTALPKLNSLGLSKVLISEAESLLPQQNYYVDLFAGMLSKKVDVEEVLKFADVVQKRPAVDEGFAKALLNIIRNAEPTSLDKSWKEIVDCIENSERFLGPKIIVSGVKSLLEKPVVRDGLVMHLVITELTKRLDSAEVSDLVLHQVTRIMVQDADLKDVVIDKCGQDIESLSNLLLMTKTEEQVYAIGGAIQLLESIQDTQLLWKLWFNCCVERNYDNIILKKAKCLGNSNTSKCKIPQSSFSPFAEAGFEVLSVLNKKSLALSLIVICFPVQSEQQTQSKNNIDILLSRINQLLEEKDFDMASIDPEAINRLIELRLVASLADGPLYNQLIEYLLGNFGADWLGIIAGDLRDSGRVLHASHLQAEQRHLHPGFRTLDVFGSLWNKYMRK